MPMRQLWAMAITCSFIDRRETAVLNTQRHQNKQKIIIFTLRFAQHHLLLLLLRLFLLVFLKRNWSEATCWINEPESLEHTVMMLHFLKNNLHFKLQYYQFFLLRCSIPMCSEKYSLIACFFSSKFKKRVEWNDLLCPHVQKGPLGVLCSGRLLYEKLGSRARGLSYSTTLRPRAGRAKCKSDNVDNCLVKIMDCWLRSMSFPNSAVVQWTLSWINCVEAHNDTEIPGQR